MLGSSVRGFLASRPAWTRATYRSRARSALRAPVHNPAADFGRYASVAPATYATAGVIGLTALGTPKPVDQAALRAGLMRACTLTLRANLPAQGPLVVRPPAEPGIVLKPPVKQKPKLDFKMSADEVAGFKYTKLRLFIKEVECLHETSEPSDSDEINLGGTVTSATGETHTIQEFKVSHDFDEGESVIYPTPSFEVIQKAVMAGTFQQLVKDTYAAPGRLFAQWDIHHDVGWPTTYVATMAMAEKDDGGFWKFLKELAKQIIKLIEDALGKSIGTAVGTAIGAFFGGWGAVVGAIIGFCIGALFDWLLGDNPDDILGVKTVTMSLGAATESYYKWTGLLKKPRPDLFPVSFKSDGGHYRVWCYFQLATK